MKKWILALALIVSSSYVVADENTDVKVAIALAKAKATVIAPAVNAKASDSQKAGTLAYAVAREKSINEKKNLVVFIGVKQPDVAKGLKKDFVSVAVPEDLFNRGINKEVLVGKFVGGELFIVPGIGLNETADSLRSKVETYQPFPKATVVQPQVQFQLQQFQQPMFLGAPGSGGCPGGVCPNNNSGFQFFRR